jgi:hypothetical protein
LSVCLPVYLSVPFLLQFRPQIFLNPLFIVLFHIFCDPHLSYTPTYLSKISCLKTILYNHKLFLTRPIKITAMEHKNVHKFIYLHSILKYILCENISKYHINIGLKIHSLYLLWNDFFPWFKDFDKMLQSIKFIKQILFLRSKVEHDQNQFRHISLRLDNQSQTTLSSSAYLSQHFIHIYFRASLSVGTTKKTVTRYFLCITRELNTPIRK